MLKGEKWSKLFTFPEHQSNLRIRDHLFAQSRRVFFSFSEYKLKSYEILIVFSFASPFSPLTQWLHLRPLHQCPQPQSTDHMPFTSSYQPQSQLSALTLLCTQSITWPPSSRPSNPKPSASFFNETYPDHPTCVCASDLLYFSEQDASDSQLSLFEKNL